MSLLLLANPNGDLDAPRSRPRVWVEAAINAAVSGAIILDDPVWGTLDGPGVLGHSEDLFADLADRCLRVSTSRGRQRQLERHTAGSASARFDNHDRALDPTNLDGPYVAAGVSYIEPMVQLRVRAGDETGDVRDLWSGFVDAWSLEWDMPEDSTAGVEATDGFKVFGRVDRNAVAAVGAGELSGARVDRLLDATDWTGPRDIDPGQSTLQATTMASNLLTELHLVADSEQGEIRMGPAGEVVYRDRHSRYTRTRSNTVQYVFGDDDGEVEYESAQISLADDLVKNRVTVGRAGGVAQTVFDLDSAGRYLWHTYSRTDLLIEDDGEAADQAAWILARFKTAGLRFDSVTVSPDRIGTRRAWGACLNADIGDLVIVRKRPPGGGSLIERRCWIEGIKHTIPVLGPGGWSTTFRMSDAETGVGAGVFILDSPVLGLLDSNILGY